jgi:hypothetical protein
VVDPGQAAWAKFWHVYLYFSFGLLVSSTLWLGIGGLRDLRNLLHNLRSTKRDHSDDGTVRPAEGAAPAVVPAPHHAPRPKEGVLARSANQTV